MMAMISGSRVLRAAGKAGTLYRDDKLGDHWQDTPASLFQHLGGAQDRQEPVGVHALAQAVEEDGQVVVIVHGLDAGLPEDLVAGALVVHLDRQVPSVVVTSELGGRDGPFLVGPADGPGRLVDQPAGQGRGGAAAGAPHALVLVAARGKIVLVAGVVLVQLLLQGLVYELGGEVPEAAVRVLGGELVLPGLVALALHLRQDALQVVLHW